jgi:hypothetical protein
MAVSSQDTELGKGNAKAACCRRAFSDFVKVCSIPHTAYYTVGESLLGSIHNVQVT